MGSNPQLVLVLLNFLGFYNLLSARCSTNTWEAIYDLPEMTEEEVLSRPLAQASLHLLCGQFSAALAFPNTHLTLHVRIRTSHVAHSMQRADIIASPMQSKSDSVSSPRLFRPPYLMTESKHRFWCFQNGYIDGSHEPAGITTRQCRGH
eukprot:SAG11_NODE_2452_length_3345_cov_3.549908_2_plen_149_part_00